MKKILFNDNFFLTQAFILRNYGQISALERQRKNN